MAHTIRQRIVQTLCDRPCTAFDLANELGIPERDVEDHLGHVIRSVNRNASHQFLVEPSICWSCHFHFHQRTRLTRPSRCPRCRSEDISSPRFLLKEKKR